MVGLLAITGGLSLAGIWLYKRRDKRMTCWHRKEDVLQAGQAVHSHGVAAIAHRLRQVCQNASSSHSQPTALAIYLEHTPVEDAAPAAAQAAANQPPLQPGYQILLSSGELVPADAMIIEGVAWLQPQVLPATKDALRKSVGDKIAATDLVLVGRILIRVLP
ncbi:MAG: hypothetical protein KF832_06350 [Caldilineaceae bacterium]|nr:hypothetical protein [Caldilineaceae bacterium]